MKAQILNEENKGWYRKGTATLNGQTFKYEITYMGGEPHNLTIEQNGRKESTVRGLPNYERVKQNFIAFGLI